MLLSTEQLRWLLEQLRWETKVEASDQFPYRIQQRGFGYRDGIAGKVQAALSIMAEASTTARKAGL